MGDIFDLFKRIASEKEAPAGKPEWLIVGLGNPGPDYVRTRHNAGFLALDTLSRRLNIPVQKAKFHALCGQGLLGGHAVLLMKPQTYMNLSGEAVREAAAFYKIPANHILVIVDDVYQAIGKVRIRKSGTNGGHNGLGNIIYQLESDQFPRIRLGVGEKPHPDYDMKDWVLGKFSDEDLVHLSAACDDVEKMCTMILDGKMEAAMGEFNGKVY